jgi:hypothetical protein
MVGSETMRPTIVMVAGFNPDPANAPTDELVENHRHISGRVSEIIIRNGGLIQPMGQAAIAAVWGCSTSLPPPHAPAHQSTVSLLESLGCARRAADEVLSATCGDRQLAVLLDAGKTHVAPLREATENQAHTVIATSLGMETAILQFRTLAPGELAITPAAERLLSAIAVERRRQIEATPPSGQLSPAQPLDTLLALLSEDRIMGRLPPRALGAIADLADGLPDLSRFIAHHVALETASLDEIRGDTDATNIVHAHLAEILDRADPLKPLLMAASLFEDWIDPIVLARAMSLTGRQIQDAMCRATRSGIMLEMRLSAPHHRKKIYQFTSRLLRNAAREALPPRTRQRLHGSIADAMIAERQVAPDAATAAGVANHLTHAGRTSEATDWWCTAAREGIAASTPVSAAAYLKHALDNLHRCEASDDPRLSQFARIVGPQLSALRGNGAQEVLSIYEASAHGADAEGEIASADHFDALWGMQTCLLVRGDMARARQIDDRLVSYAEAQAATHIRILALRLSGLMHFLIADLEQAERCYERVLDLHVCAQHAQLRHSHASDQATLAHAHLAWVHAMKGDQAQANLNARAALQRAEKLNHPHTTAHSVCVLAAMYVSRHEPAAAAPLAIAARALAQRHGFPYWNAWAAIMHAASESHRSSREAGNDLRAGIDAYTATGARQILPFAIAEMARHEYAFGDTTSAVASLAKGLSIATETGMIVFSSRLNDLRSSVVNMKNNRLRQNGHNHLAAAGSSPGLATTKMHFKT